MYGEIIQQDTINVRCIYPDSIWLMYVGIFNNMIVWLNYAEIKQAACGKCTLKPNRQHVVSAR